MQFKTKEIRCTNCGAPVKDVDLNQKTIKCKYCSKEFVIEKGIDFEKRVQDINKVVESENLGRLRDELKGSIYTENFKDDVASEILYLLPDDLEANLFKHLSYRNKSDDNEAYLSFLSDLTSRYDECEIRNCLDDMITHARFNELEVIQNLIDDTYASDETQEKLDSKRTEIRKKRREQQNIVRDCFICAAKEDLETVKELVKELENNQINCWYKERNNDTRNDSAIENAINKCTLFIYVNSPYTFNDTGCIKQKELAEKLGKEYRFIYSKDNNLLEQETKEFIKNDNTLVFTNLTSLFNKIKNQLYIIKNTKIDPYEEKKKMVDVKMKGGDFESASFLIDQLLTEPASEFIIVPELWVKKLTCATLGFTYFNDKAKNVFHQLAQNKVDYSKINELRNKLNQLVSPILFNTQDDYERNIKAIDILTYKTKEVSVDEFLSLKTEPDYALAIIDNFNFVDVNNLKNYENKQVSFLLYRKNSFNVKFGFNKDNVFVSGEYNLKITDLNKMNNKFSFISKPLYIYTWKDIRNYVRENNVIESNLSGLDLSTISKEKLEEVLNEKLGEWFSANGLSLVSISVANLNK